MKILAVNWLDPDNPHAGGAEVHLFEILKRLAQWGHEVSVVCSGWNRVGSGIRGRGPTDGISIHRIGGRHSFALRGRGAVRRMLRGGAFDIVIEDINKLPLLLPTLTRLPVYVIVPHLFGTTAFAEAAWPVAAVVWAAELPIPWVYRRSAFHAISDSTKDDLVRRGIDAARVRVIYPGVDTSWYAPAAPSVCRSDRPSFLYVGRLKRYKGVETAIRAVGIARDRGVSMSLVIAGTGDDRSRLEALSHELSLTDVVRFDGFVDEEEKRDRYRTSWAVVLPSAKEGWGLTNVEAAACGTPAIAADRPGLRETVRHEETGLLVPHGEPDRLADALTRLARDPALVERFGRAARQFAESLPWDRTARLTESHLQETLERGRAP